MATVTGTKSYTVVAAGVATVTGSTPYTVGTQTNSVSGTTSYTVTSATVARAYRRAGTTLNAVRLGMRRGTTIDWLTAALTTVASTVRKAVGFGPLVVIADPDPTGELNEASGLVISKQNTNPGKTFWSHNDNGGLPIIYGFDEVAPHELIAKYTIGGATNSDWECIAVGPGPVSGKQYIYVGDTGSGNPDPKTIYRFPEPVVTRNQALVTATVAANTVDVFNYTAPFTDCEAMIVDPVTGDLFLFQKGNNATKPLMANVARCPASQLVAGGATITFTIVASITANTNSVNTAGFTDADISKDGDYFAVCNYEEVWLWNRDVANGQTITQALTANPTGPVYQHFTSGWGSESLAFSGEKEPQQIYTLAEGVNANLKRTPIIY